MEEIDIIELFKRVKEGKAPKKIMIEDYYFYYNEECEEITDMYSSNTCYWVVKLKKNKLDTKIKILDKPFVEELPENENIDIYDLSNKVNEIIRYLRSKDER